MTYINCLEQTTKEKVLDIMKNLKNGVEIANNLGISNLLYNESYVDLLIAVCLGHKYNISTQGCDALDEEGNPVEYKCIVKKNNTYSGSFQFHWLSADKIEKYRQCSHFYFAWRNAFEIEKIIRVESKRLMPEILAHSSGGGSTDAHKNFTIKKIEQLVKDDSATIVYP